MMKEIVKLPVIDVSQRLSTINSTHSQTDIENTYRNHKWFYEQYVKQYHDNILKTVENMKVKHVVPSVEQTNSTDSKPKRERYWNYEYL